MDLIFQTSGGNPFCIEVGYFDTVLEIKEKIQKDQGIPLPKQTLIFNGKILHDDLNVHHSDILDRSRIHLAVASGAANLPIKTADDFSLPSKIHLLLKMPSSKVVIVEMDLKDTIHKLKEKLCELEGVPASRSVIHVNGTELNDQKSLQDCELADNSEVIVGVRSSPFVVLLSRSSQGNAVGSVKLRAMVLCGVEKIPVEMNSSDKVSDIRKKLQKMNLDLPREGYFFIYRQNVMDDDRSLRWHHFLHGDTIEIFPGSVSDGS